MSGSSDRLEAEPPLDWSGIRLVVFDVDGTLYRQRPLRMRMAAKLLRHAATRLDLSALTVLRSYRKLRETLGDEEVADFEVVLRRRTADAAGVPIDKVGDIVDRWIDREPLPYLAACAYDHVGRLFGAIRRTGRGLGVCSDYPASAKLSALGLSADPVVTALDVGLLKPNPASLQELISRTDAKADETLLIGDRVDRDGHAAQRAGAHALIRSSKPIPGWRTFARYDDPVFAPFLS